MSFDHHALLAALVDREECEPGQSLDGADLVQRFHRLAGDEMRGREVVIQAARQLRRLGWIEWRYMLWPQDRGREPDPQFIDQNNIQKAQDIVVTQPGLAAYASRKQSQVATTQVNIINSSVGQLALGDIHNVTLSSVLTAIEEAVERIDGSGEAKEEARGLIRRLRQGAVSIAGSAAGGVIEAAVRRSLGLP
jgi:hypothetical protein